MTETRLAYGGGDGAAFGLLEDQSVEHDTAIACRNDAALAIRLAFAAMRRQIEALQTQEVTHD